MNKWLGIKIFICLIGIVLVSTSCSGEIAETGKTKTPSVVISMSTEKPVIEETTPPEEEEQQGPPPEIIEMEITSPAFNEGETIPEKYTCLGLNVPPEINWSGIPEGTISLTLIVDDPDAPVGTFTHWVVFNIPAEFNGLEEAFTRRYDPPEGILQGKNSFGSIGYGGPCPPPGSPHHYHFTLYALNVTLDLLSGASKTQVINTMKDHILSQTELVGIFEDRR